MESVCSSFAALSLKGKPTTPRGRAAALINSLNNINKQQIKLTAPYKGTEGTSINITSSSTTITLTRVYLYEASFNTVLDNLERCSFLRRFFTSLGVACVYDDNKHVYMSQQLADDQLHFTLISRKLQQHVTLTLSFKHSILFNQDVLDLILLDATVLQDAIIYSYSGSITLDVLNLVQNAYTVDNNNFFGVVDRFLTTYGKIYKKAVEFALCDALFYNEITKRILKLVSIDWDNALLCFKWKGCNVFSSFNDCRLITLATIGCNNTMSDIRNTCRLFDNWNLKISDFITLKARVLNRVLIVFGDNGTFVPEYATWAQALRKNDFYMPVTITCWIIFYLPGDLQVAQGLYEHIDELQDMTGMTIGKPFFIEIESHTKSGYLKALCSVRNQNIELFVVIIPQPKNNIDPVPLIKHICSVKNPIPCITVTASDVFTKDTVHDIVAKMNVVLGGSLWSVVIPGSKTMFCGIDVQLVKTKNVCSFVTSLYDCDATQWYSKVDYFTNFKQCYKTRLKDALEKYRHLNGYLPERLIIYQNTKQYPEDFFNDVLGVLVCIVFVKSGVDTCFYHKDAVGCFYNIQCGTVVDHTLTNPNTKSFFMASNCVKPIYYEIIKDTCNFKPDEIQGLTYKLCHIYYKYAKVGKMPAPLLYARRLSKFVVKTILDVPSSQLDTCLYYI